MEKAPFLRQSPTRKQTHESKPTKVNKTQSTLSVRLVTKKRKPQRLPQTPCDRARGDGSGKPEAPRTRGAGERGQQQAGRRRSQPCPVCPCHFVDLHHLRNEAERC